MYAISDFDSTQNESYHKLDSFRNIYQDIAAKFDFVFIIVETLDESFKLWRDVTLSPSQVFPDTSTAHVLNQVFILQLVRDWNW